MSRVVSALTGSMPRWKSVLTGAQTYTSYMSRLKASVDESFFDLALYVRKQLLCRFPYLNVAPENLSQGLDTPLPPPPASVRDELDAASWEALGIWMPVSSPLTWTDICIALGAERLISVRKEVRDVLGYTTYVVAD